MCHLDGRNHSADELSGCMNQYSIGSAQTSSRYESAYFSTDNYSSFRQYGG